MQTRAKTVPERQDHPPLKSCRSVDNYERLNHIEEGTYGIVFRARCKETGEIVALKRLKLEEEKYGFPITSLREIHSLLICQHPHIVNVREIVVGDTLNQIYIVMDFVEHDLKTLMHTMPEPFLISEVKTLLKQLLEATAHAHSNWILHRDLKASNLLMNNRGQIKVADFGMARRYADPVDEMTQLVVTLWYRAPEILLGEKKYTTAVDAWSIGCIFGELITSEPMFGGRSELEQLKLIFTMLGQPSDDIWSGFSKLPHAKSINTSQFPLYSSLRQHYKILTESGIDLMAKLLTYDPKKRISCVDALKHPFFKESPLPKHPDLFSSFPSVAAGEQRIDYNRSRSPTAPRAHNSQGKVAGYDFVNSFMRWSLIKRSTQIVHTNPIDLWRAKLALGEIDNDRDQLAILTRLKGHHKELCEYTPPLELLRTLKPISRALKQESGWINSFKRLTNLRSHDDHDKETALVKSLTGTEALEGLQTPKGILLYGDPGSGKSFILDIWFGSLPTSRKIRLHYHAFMTLVYGLVWEEMQRRRGIFSEEAQKSNPVDLEAENSLMMHTSISFAVARKLFLNHGHILYLDELQMLDIASAVLLRDTLSWFLRFGGILLSTSNKPPSELYAKGVGSKNLNDFLFALERRCNGLNLDAGIDHRTTKPHGETISWFVNDRHEFECLVEKLMGSERQSRKLMVYGREVYINETSKGIAKFTFTELCDSPLGASDYLALASTFDTIIIDQIPVMRISQKNQARRFITLIDALYESKCRLIAYAQDNIDRLFFPDSTGKQEEIDDLIAYEAISEGIEAQSSPHVSSAGTISSKLQTRPAQQLHGLAILSGEDEKFAYRRAVSRLIEMGSSNYLTNHPEKWISLPISARVWEKSTNATKGIKKLAEMATHGEDFGEEYNNPGGILQRDNAPVFSNNHVWGVREDHGMGLGSWGMGSRAYEDTPEVKEETAYREERKHQRLERKRKEFKS